MILYYPGGPALITWTLKNKELSPEKNRQHIKSEIVKALDRLNSLFQERSHMESMRKNVGSKETGISVYNPQGIEYGQTRMRLETDEFPEPLESTVSRWYTDFSFKRLQAGVPAESYCHWISDLQNCALIKRVLF